jgi:hypothetical protein
MEDYIVTLHKKEELDGFYDDMETEGGTVYIPERRVVVSARKPMSRSTIYILTEEEVQLLKNDIRVRSVVRVSDVGDFEPMSFTRSGDYDKSMVYQTPDSPNSRNWALWRVRNSYSNNSAIIDNWYPDFLTGVNTQKVYSGSTTQNETGKNVDIVIVDGHIDPAHPEMAVNEDGTGGTRVFSIDWNQYDAEVRGDNPGLGDQYFLSGSYNYTPYRDPWGSSTYSDASLAGQMEHGASVASQAAGNRQGSAIGANVYNICPYNQLNQALGNTSLTLNFSLIDYIRAFHNNKPINPETGCKNPTIVNMSIGFSLSLSESTRWPYYAENPRVSPGSWGDPNNTSYRLSNAEMEAAQIAQSYEISGSTGSRSVALTACEGYVVDFLIADIEDAIADGIHFVISAGNNGQLLKNPGTTAYNQTFMKAVGITGDYNYHGRSFAPSDAILVGALSGSPQNELTTGGKGEMPIFYTNRGEGVDVYMFADGSTASTNDGTYVNYDRTDDRNGTFFMRQFNGTSSAAPILTGFLACLLERFPDMSPQALKEYMASRCKGLEDNEIGDQGQAWPVTYQRNYSFEPNETPKVLMYLNDIRPSTGRIETKNFYGPRTSSGSLYPRTRSARTYRTRA